MFSLSPSPVKHGLRNVHVRDNVGNGLLYHLRGCYREGCVHISVIRATAGRPRRGRQEADRTGGRTDTRQQTPRGRHEADRIG